MGVFAVGQVVLVPFPYADFATFKKRPALVIGKAEFNNLILCQITSNASTSQRALNLTDDDFDEGSLPISSFVRPDKLFTIEPSIIETKLGSLKNNKTEDVKEAVRKLFN
jgi:mRNA interferase MazF